MLDDGGVSHCDTGEEEAKCDASDGSHGDAELAEKGVDVAVHDGDEDDDRERVDVLHDVVGDAMELHLAGLRNKIVDHLAVDAPVDGEEDKDTAGDEGSFELKDEVVGPWGGVGRTVFLSI